MIFDQKVAGRIFQDSKPALFLMISNNEESKRASEAFHLIARKLEA